MVGRRPAAAKRPPHATHHLCLLAGSVFLALACGEEPSEPIEHPRLVLLYAPCTVSKTFLSPYRSGIAYTPNLEGFARRSVTLAAHRTEAGSSGIAYASLFTGSQADRHGVTRHPGPLRGDVLVIGEAYADQGYETWYWNGQPMAGTGLGYGRGIGPERAFARPLEAGDPKFESLLSELQRDREKRVFVMTNFTMTHGPYSSMSMDAFLSHHPEEDIAVAPERRLRLLSLYRENSLALAFNFGETLGRLGIGAEHVNALSEVVELAYKSNVWRLDGAFGEVLAAIDAHGLRDESLVVFTADHGEVLYRERERFKFTHSSSLAPEVVEVPLIIRSPALGAARYEGITRSMDVLPTMLGLSGLRMADDERIDGFDLSSALRGTSGIPSLEAYSHTSVIPTPVYRQMRQPGGRAVWGKRMQIYPRQDIRLIEVARAHEDRVSKLTNVDGTRFRDEAFDRVADPLETSDRFDRNDPGDREAAAAVRAYKEALIAGVEALEDGPRPTRRAREEAETALRELGYIE